MTVKLCSISKNHGIATNGDKCAICWLKVRQRVQKRMAKNATKGLCIRATSHGPAAPGRKSCQKCLDYENEKSQKYYERSSEKKICVCCRKNESKPGYVKCEGCRVKRANKSALVRKQKLCVINPAHGPAVQNMRTCQSCRDHSKNKRAIYEANGMCKNGGPKHPRPMPGFKLCEACKLHFHAVKAALDADQDPPKIRDFVARYAGTFDPNEKLTITTIEQPRTTQSLEVKSRSGRPTKDVTAARLSWVVGLLSGGNSLEETIKLLMQESSMGRKSAVKFIKRALAQNVVSLPNNGKTHQEQDRPVEGRDLRQVRDDGPDDSGDEAQTMRRVTRRAA